jgi:hypothetical protein
MPSEYDRGRLRKPCSPLGRDLGRLLVEKLPQLRQPLPESTGPLFTDQHIRSTPATAFFLFKNSLGDQVLNIPQRRIV